MGASHAPRRASTAPITDGARPRPTQAYALVPPDACAARCAWYAFQPGHQPVCHFHSRDMKDLGLASAFARAGQVSHAWVFVEVEVLFVSMDASFHRAGIN